MSNEFQGFTRQAPADLHAVHLHLEESRRFLGAILTRLGPRIAGARFHSGRDERGGRDYFFENVEFHVRGRRDPCFMGFFHYARPDHRAGSWWEVWEWEHDDEPIVRTALSDLVAEGIAQREAGRLSDWLTDQAEAIRRHLGLDV